MTTTSLGTILAIWAHPDDETYLAGGLMAAARDEGQRVVCAAATAGERGSADPAWPPARLARTRRWEAGAAMDVLGVVEHSIHDLPDGALAEHEDRGRAWAAELMADVRPDTVLTFGADGMTFHPDHVAVHRWVTRTWREGGCPGSLLYATPTTEALERFGPLYEEWDMYMSDQRPAGTPRDRLALRVELRGAELDRKVAALRAMATQTSGVSVAVGEESYAAMVAEEAFVAALRSRPVAAPAADPVTAMIADLAGRAARHPELRHLR